MRSRYLVAALTVLVVFGAAAAPIPARADLVLAGTYRRHTAVIRRVWDQLPARGKRIDVELHELSAQDWHLVDDYEGEGVLGLYFPGSKRIYVAGDYPHLAQVVAHEVGHHVWFCTLTDAERERWSAFWAAHIELMNRPYARTSAVEGWAESYMVTYYPAKGPFGTVADVVKRHMHTYFSSGMWNSEAP